MKIKIPGQEKKFDRFGPAGFFLFGWALFLDFLGVLDFVPYVGTVISVISDVLGIMTIGVLSWRSMGSLPFPEKVKRFFTKRAGARWLLEMIPLVGIAPLWTIYVYRHMTK